MLFELRNLFPDLKIIDIEVSYDKENKANSIETVEVEYTFVQQPKWRFLQAETMFEEIRNISVRRR
jgi:hypothetical protein